MVSFAMMLKTFCMFRQIKMSSPNLNNVIIIGCILCYSRSSKSHQPLGPLILFIRSLRVSWPMTPSDTNVDILKNTLTHPKISVSSEIMALQWICVMNISQIVFSVIILGLDSSITSTNAFPYICTAKVTTVTIIMDNLHLLTCVVDFFACP